LHAGSDEVLECGDGTGAMSDEAGALSGAGLFVFVDHPPIAVAVAFGLALAAEHSRQLTKANFAGRLSSGSGK